MRPEAVRLSGRIAVVSPHLDDAVLSLGAGLHRASRSGANVTVVTVFAGGTDSTRPAGRWDRLAGFATAGEAMRARHEEDQRACALLGVEHRWLPFLDDQYEHSRDKRDISAAIADALDGADVVLTPGFPLVHADHELVSRLVASLPRAGRRLGLYVEQPYAFREHLTSTRRPPVVHGPWRRVESDLRARVTKCRACCAYGSQLRPLGLRFRAARVVRTTERVAWVES